MANNFEMIFEADSLLPDVSNTARLEIVQNRPYWAFATDAVQFVVTKAFPCPARYTGGGTLKADLFWICSVTTGGVMWLVQVEAVTPADALDLDATTSYDISNQGGQGVPATAGYLAVTTLSLTSKDTIAINDYVRLKIGRNGVDEFDDAAGDARLLIVRLREEQ